MKITMSWKQRFLRKKLKYMFVLVCIAGVIFVGYQLLYFNVLNQVIVGKLISGSIREPHYVITGNQHSKWNQPVHSKLIRDKNGTTVSLRGTRDQDIAKYLPNARGKFVCFTSRIEIDFVKINDDYCDCPLDGSDEPGTNACNNGVFNCETTSTKFPGRISSHKVNDGFCDCCDGSDEWAEAPLSYVLNGSKAVTFSKTKCPNKC